MTTTVLGTSAALITGASSGIGEATARRLAATGAAVAIVARRKDRLDQLAAEIASAGGRAVAIEADITEQEQAEAAVKQAADELGSLDIVVNNAGVMLLGPALDAPTDEWERMISINLNGLLYVTKAAMPHLLDAAEHGNRRVADLEVRAAQLRRFESMELMAADDIADAIEYVVTRPRHVAINEVLIRPTEQDA